LDTIEAAMSTTYTSKIFSAATIGFLLNCATISAAWTPGQYTTRQFQAFAERIGNTYWTASAENHELTLLTAPAANASSFQAPADEAFEVTDLVGQKAQAPFYKVRFASGKQGFISPENFLEELNVTIFSVDLKADEKRKAAAAAEEERDRVRWIQSQPWSQTVKDAAMRKEVVVGMNPDEVRKVLGNPTRATKIQSPQGNVEEQWFYPDGNVVVFNNGLLNRVQRKSE
jgi:hypothetical protein